jgi:hypothetical protein
MRIGSSYLWIGRACCLYRQVSTTWTLLNTEAENSPETSVTIYRTHGVICQKKGIFVRSALRTESSRKADAADVWSERVVAGTAVTCYDQSSIPGDWVLGLGLLLAFLCPPHCRTLPSISLPVLRKLPFIFIFPLQYFETRAGEIAPPSIPRMSYCS